MQCGASRLKKGLDAVTGEEVTDDSETEETSTVRPRSFDVAPSGYVAPPSGGGWLSGLLPSSDSDAAVVAAVDSATTAPSAAGVTGNSELFVYASARYSRYIACRIEARRTLTVARQACQESLKANIRSK